MNIIYKAALFCAASLPFITTAFADELPTRFGNYKNIVTREGTNSTTFTDLATPDKTVITLPSDGFVTVMYRANINTDPFGCGGTPHDIINVDGKDKPGSETMSALTAWTFYIQVGSTLPTMYTLPLKGGGRT